MVLDHIVLGNSMKFMSKWIAISLLVYSAVSVSACRDNNSQTVTDKWGAVQVRGDQTIRIGIVVPTPNEAISAEGTDIVRGAELALQDQGRIDGHSIEIVTFNGECSPAGGRSAAQSVVADSTFVGVIGPVCSQACEAAAEVFENKHLTAISPSCGASALTDQVTHSGSFMRTMYDDRLEGEAAARFSYMELGARSAITVSDGTSDTVDLVDSFETTFQSFGGTIMSRVVITPGDSQFDTIPANADTAVPGVIYAPLLSADAVTLTTQLAAIDMAKVPLVGGRHYVTASYLAQSGDDAEGRYAVGSVLSGPSYDNLLAQYKERYGEDPATTQFAYSYDAVMIMTEAIKTIAATNPQNTLLIGRQALRQALYQTTTYPGVTGTLSCSSWGDCGTTSLGIYRVQNHAWTVTYAP